MTDAGNIYDASPPVASPGTGNAAGRKPEAREQAEAFLRNLLEIENDQLYADLCESSTKAGGSAKTFERAFQTLEKEGTLVKDGGRGTGRRMLVHLIARRRLKPVPHKRGVRQNARTRGFCHSGGHLAAASGQAFLGAPSAGVGLSTPCTR